MDSFQFFFYDFIDDDQDGAVAVPSTRCQIAVVGGFIYLSWKVKYIYSITLFVFKENSRKIRAITDNYAKYKMLHSYVYSVGCTLWKDKNVLQPLTEKCALSSEFIC